MSDFRPALRFLATFIGVYVVLNVVYGAWVSSYGTRPDPMTVWVSRQTAGVETTISDACNSELNEKGPTVFLRDETGRTVLNVFEGCNGLNVMVVFIAFVLAFGGTAKKMLWFIPAGLVIIHLSNLVRLLFLYYLADTKSHYFYYFHKYFFTGAIYLIVFILWWVWVRYFHQRHVRPGTA